MGTALAKIKSQKTWKEWVGVISASWQKGVESILDTGRNINDAKADLDHGQFESMVNLKLPFGPSTARRLMAVADNKVIANRAHAHVLPPSWMTLYALTTIDKKLGDGTLQKLLTDGTINAKTERSEQSGYHVVTEGR